MHEPEERRRAEVEKRQKSVDVSASRGHLARGEESSRAQIMRTARASSPHGATPGVSHHVRLDAHRAIAARRLVAQRVEPQLALPFQRVPSSSRIVFDSVALSCATRNRLAARGI
jgi:hypothetical protein